MEKLNIIIKHLDSLVHSNDNRVLNFVLLSTAGYKRLYYIINYTSRSTKSAIVKPRILNFFQEHHTHITITIVKTSKNTRTTTAPAVDPFGLQKLAGRQYAPLD